ncbi:hypothetical protein G7046_g646 [Stylonectria norvegica]|nr:hypothetical protein G7046_g646 [Stylonectria norvegica]
MSHFPSTTTSDLPIPSCVLPYSLFKYWHMEAVVGTFQHPPVSLDNTAVPIQFHARTVARIPTYSASLAGPEVINVAVLAYAVLATFNPTPPVAAQQRRGGYATGLQKDNGFQPGTSDVGINNLPARPPASKSGFRPAFSAAPQPSAQPYANAAPSYPGSSSYSAAPPTAQYGPSFPSYPGAAPGGMSASAPPTYAYPQQSQQQQQQPPQQQQQQNYGPQSFAQPGYAAPQIRNPFPLPGAPGGDYDPEMAAQIAQWQSAYVSKDGREGKTPGATDLPKPEVQIPVPAASDKKKTVVREGGGKKWTDESLLEWDPAHLRLFVGNLAGETTDESLLKAFSRWHSVQKARVIRDKRTTKSKGFGFVSFSSADDFFQAAKEMNGKYIQSHPVVVRKANTEIKVTNAKEKVRGGKKNNKKGGSGGGSGGGGGGYEPSLGPAGGAGVTKPGQKTKNGLRLLG